jgi:transketolase
LKIRLRAVRMVAPQGFGYLGQALSSAEQVAAIFAAARPGLDHLVCSPGHYIIAPFAAAGELGLIDDYTCGSLGQGLSAAVGFALSDQLRARDARTFAMVSDGEMEEGQLWEAAIFAAHHGLGALTVLLDANNSQVDGPVDSITTIEPIADKWAAFGWHVTDLDGHDVDKIGAALADAAQERQRPSVLVCRTSTVHGVDCLPSDADGHFIKLPPELAAAAVDELTRKVEEIHA